MQPFPEMDRRALMARAMQLLGATVVVGGTAGLAGCKQADVKGKPMDAEQLALLGAIADTIIPVTDTPGAVGVGVPKKLDAMLVDWASPERRTELMGAMDEIDELAKSASGKGFAALDSAKRKELLLAHDAQAVKPGPPPKIKPTGLAAMVGGTPTMNPAYVKLKELIINLYYSSEIASTKELVFEPVPGKYVASLKVTPETRPFAGLGGPF
jgi:gluconate 2-dehydrogenase gamma chain